MQTRRHSVLEAISNIVLGYGVSLFAQIVIFKYLGISVPLSQNIAIGLVFTAISLIRSYTIRRLFNRYARRK